MGKKIAFVQCAASAASTAGVFFGQGPSSKVSTTSPSRRKSYALNCSKPKPGPPVVSISTTREMPSALGLPGQEAVAVAGGMAADCACAGAGAGAATGAAATAGEPCASRVETFGGTSDAEANLAGLADGTLRSSAGRTTVRANSTAGPVCVSDVKLLGMEAPRQRKAPKPIPIASAHTIAAMRMAIRLFR